MLNDSAPVALFSVLNMIDMVLSFVFVCTASSSPSRFRSHNAIRLGLKPIVKMSGVGANDSTPFVTPLLSITDAVRSNAA